MASEMAGSFDPRFDLSECYEQVLKKHKEELFKFIDLNHLLSHLFTHKVVTEVEKKILLHECLHKPDKAKEVLFDILIRKGYMAFYKILKALEEEKEHAGHATLHRTLVIYEGLFTETQSTDREYRSDWTTQREELVINRTVPRSRTKPIGCTLEENTSQIIEIRLGEIRVEMNRRLGVMETMIGRLGTKMDQFLSQFSNISRANNYDHNEEITPLPRTENILDQSIVNNPLNNAQTLPRVMKPTEVDFSWRNLRFNPLFLNYKVHFVYQLSNKVVTDSYNFNNNEWEEKIYIGSISNDVCSTMLHLIGKLTVFGGDSDKVALYTLNVEKRSWQLVKSSKFPFHEMNFKNSICAHYVSSGKDRVVAITVLQASSCLIYHFSPEKDGDTNWKCVVLSLPHLETQYQIQSCVVNAHDMYFSLLSNTHLFVYQINLGPLEQDICSSLMPKSSWCLENLSNIKKCFLSLLEDDVVTIMIKRGNIIEVSYLSSFNSGSLNPLPLNPSNMEVISAAIIPDTTNMAVLCHENNKHKLLVLNAPAHLMKDKAPTRVEENDSVSTACTDTYKPADDFYHDSNTSAILDTPVTTDSGFPESKSFPANNTPKEHKVLKQNYDKITSSLTDIDSLLSKLVTKEVIDYNQEKDIMAKVKETDKVKKTLGYILGPLEKGYTTGFYIFLEIMESGTIATKELAKDLKKSLDSDVL